MKHCEEHATELGEPLWYAWITNAIRCKGGREYIHEFSAKHPEYSKRKTDRKIAHALNDTGPMTHETIKGIGYDCDCPAKYRQPVTRATYINLSSEIEHIAGLKDMEEKASETKRILSYWRELDAVDRDLYRSMLKNKLKLSRESLVVNETGPEDGIDYCLELREILERLRIEGRDDVVRARAVFEWFQHHEKAPYFTDETEKHYIYTGKKLILMEEGHSDFEALLLNAADISTATPFGRITVQVMNASAHSSGRRIRKNTWLETDQEKLSIILNLKNESQELLKITPDGCTIIQNGDNPDHVFMLNTQWDKLRPITFIPMNDGELKKALVLSEDLIVKHTPCIDHEK
jgi:hypothetical protein